MEKGSIENFEFNVHHLINFFLSLEKDWVSGETSVIYRAHAKLCSWSHPGLYINVFSWREDLAKKKHYLGRERKVRGERREGKARQGKTRTSKEKMFLTLFFSVCASIIGHLWTEYYFTILMTWLHIKNLFMLQLGFEPLIFFLLTAIKWKSTHYNSSHQTSVT